MKKCRMRKCAFSSLNIFFKNHVYVVKGASKYFNLNVYAYIQVNITRGS